MKPKISAVILAGGQGRRFSNQDKGLLIRQGAPLISYVIDCIQPQVDQIIINCNRNINQYQRFGYQLSQDQLSNYQGPLAGIQSSLKLSKYPYTLICPCDTPELPANLTSILLTALINSNADVAYPKTNTRKHYLPVLIKSNLLPSLEAYLCTKDRSMKGWYSTLRDEAVVFTTDEKSFMNINTPDLL